MDRSHVSMVTRAFGADNLPIRVTEYPNAGTMFYTLQFGSDTDGIILFCECERRADMAAKLRAAADEIEKPLKAPVAA